MVYKYQIETIEYLRNVVGKLENLTEDKMSLKIGYARGEFLNSSGTSYYLHSGDLYLQINYDDCFKIVDDFRTEYFNNVREDSAKYIRFDSDIFLKLNEWIDKIYSDKKEREEFYERLNQELKALNKSL